tara:strand:+ start:715 stop:876 length:162 start_codon:yes stop_codon:yes gene_type:complete
MQSKRIIIETDSQAQDLYQRAFDLEEKGHVRLALEEREQLVAYDEKTRISGLF